MSAQKAFGPSALLTPANALTSVRLAAAPLFALLVVAIGPSSWLLWVLWSALAASDGLDGYVARRHGVTRSGAFLDPLADKFLVVAALFALVSMGLLSYWPVAVITAREVAMSAYRVHAGRRGISVPASKSAKAKTLAQDIAIGLFFFPPTAAHHLLIARDLLWLAVALTLASGAEYVRDGRRLLRDRAGATPVIDRAAV